MLYLQEMVPVKFVKENFSRTASGNFTPLVVDRAAVVTFPALRRRIHYQDTIYKFQ